ncbi:MAG: hypothetical protein RLN88_04705 [Ekhidna sp.]|uniref:hypothetical protein n=1 Tax=Ekhidna sp. TaxID=2608089 RepID=UPI0032EBFB6D
MTGCYEKDVFPDTPKLTFEDLVFYDGNLTDSLILSFSFEDGNGDIGIIEGQDVLPPFNEFDVYIDSRDTVANIENLADLVPPIFTAPLITQNFIPRNLSNNTLTVEPSDSDYPILAFAREMFSEDVNDIPFLCPGLANQDGTFLSSTTLTSYQFASGTTITSSTGPQVITSTIPVIRNETHFNFIIEFQRKVGESYLPLNYQEIFGTELCDIGVFNGRIPLYDPDGKSGTITYAIQSTVLRLAFQDDVIRAKFYVYDRAGIKSNEIFTPDFVLADITQ